MVKREIEVRLTPSELAELFCAMCGDEQAEFFDRVGAISADWPATGWCLQACDIVSHLTPTGRATVATLAGHLETTPGDWIDWTGGECPVLDCVRVDVRFRDGDVAENRDPAGWDWHHHDFDIPGSRSAGDIIAYRLSDASA